MQWGDKIEFLEELEEKGINPKALDNKPELYNHLQWYMTSFNILSSRRPVNNIEGAIPISEIRSYLEMYPWYDVDLFFKLILKMDDEYLKFRQNNDNQAIDFRSSN